MSADIERLPKPHNFRFRSWCEECQDGYQGGKVAATKWAYLHNANHHESEGNE